MITSENWRTKIDRKKIVFVENDAECTPKRSMQWFTCMSAEAEWCHSINITLKLIHGIDLSFTVDVATFLERLHIIFFAEFKWGIICKQIRSSNTKCSSSSVHFYFLFRSLEVFLVVYKEKAGLVNTMSLSPVPNIWLHWLVGRK